MFFEVYRDSRPNNRLFFTPQEAQAYIDKQTDGASYEIKPYAPW